MFDGTEDNTYSSSSERGDDVSLLRLLVIREVIVLIFIIVLLIVILLVELVLLVIDLSITGSLGKLESLGLLELKLVLVNFILDVKVAVDLRVTVISERRGQRLVSDLDDGTSVLGAQVFGKSSVGDGERVSDVKGVLLP
jgi:hypothetical protein